MRRFREKIAWQRKVLASVNEGLPLTNQLPGLTAQTIDTWAAGNPGLLPPEVVGMIVKAAELSGSINDFSAPVTASIDDVREGLDSLCSRIRQATTSRSGL